jgi:thymidylate synthase
MTDLKPGNLIISLGDAHVYTDHLDQIREQMKRTPLAPPVLLVDDNVKNKRVEDLDVSDFKIVGYHHHPRIMGTMSV